MSASSRGISWFVAALASFVGAALVAPPAAHADAELTKALKNILNTYERCIRERYETPQTQRMEQRDTVKCMAGNPCSRADRLRAWDRISAQVNRGDDRNFTDNLLRATPEDCMPERCGEHRMRHTLHVHCTMKVGGNDEFKHGFGKGIGYETCKGGYKIGEWFRYAARDIAKELGDKKAAAQAEAGAHIGGACMDKNHRTIDRPAAEGCKKPNFSSDYFFPPKAMLDWSPTPAPSFKIMLIDSLKALLIGAGAVGAAVVGPLVGPLFGPFVAGGIAGGFAGIAHHGIPGGLIGLPVGTPATAKDYDKSVREPHRYAGKGVGANEGRLRPDLRVAAKSGAPLTSLCTAAEYYVLNDEPNGKAFADLSVTGKRSFSVFKRFRPSEDKILPCLKARPKMRGKSEKDLKAAVGKALDRAYDVAWILRAGGACKRERFRLGWIAVSGEDDQPHRPVNVPATKYPQYDIAVTVRGITVNSRFTIAAHTGPKAPACTPSKRREMPPDLRPTIPANAEVLFYVNGMDSRLEEPGHVAEALHTRHAKKNWTVVSVDAPSAGYADNIDPERVSRIGDMGEGKFRYHGAADLELTDLQVFNARGKQNTKILDFIEDFVVAFVRQVPGLGARIRAVVGGSLGGNMTLRLGRRAGAPWPKTTMFVPWSPAAIWKSFGDGNNPGSHLVLSMPWMWAGGDARLRTESAWSRRNFFYKKYDWSMGPLGKIAKALGGGGKPQAEEWYSDKWDCKKYSIAESRIGGHETYDRNFRLWHWRLGAEQLLYSHQGGDGEPVRYLGNKTNTLLICGYDDTGGGLCQSTRDVARKMVNTPGKALFLRNTGHSIHDERPQWLANHIVEFLGARHPACKRR